MPAKTLYRLAGVSGGITALLMVVNTLRRAGVIPGNLLTHGVAPLAECFGLLALTGLYLVQRKETGVLGVVGYALNTIGLVGTFGLDLTSNWVLPYLSPEQGTALLAGATGKLLLAASVVFLLGVVLFGIATWRAGRLPAVAMALYVAGLLPVALRTVVPSPVVNVGLLITTVGTVWLATALWGVAAASTNTQDAEPVPA
jgi:hypothetical protein